MTDEPEQPAVESTKTRKRRRWPWILLGLVLLLGVGSAGVWAYIHFDLWRPQHWKSGDHPHQLACGDNCTKIGPMGAPHGPADAGPVAVLAFDPKVNDDVAQWGDCLQSVANCTYSVPGTPEQVIPQCVQRSACPKACKDRFASTTSGLKGKAMLDAYLAMFSGKDGYCTPRGA